MDFLLFSIIYCILLHLKAAKVIFLWWQCHCVIISIISSSSSTNTSIKILFAAFTTIEAQICHVPFLPGLCCSRCVPLLFSSRLTCWNPQVLNVCLCFRVDMKHRFRRDLMRGEAESTMSKQKLQQRMREQWVHTHTLAPVHTWT